MSHHRSLVRIILRFAWGMGPIILGDVAIAQGITTLTTSVTFSSSVESPPSCSPIGSTRTIMTVGLPTTTVGPSCIGVGDRSIGNPIPACGAFPPAPPPVDPFRGTTFLVGAGDTNINVNTNTETISCVAAPQAAAVPATSHGALAALALALGSIATVFLYRRRASKV